MRQKRHAHEIRLNALSHDRDICSDILQYPRLAFVEHFSNNPAKSQDEKYGLPQQVSSLVPKWQREEGRAGPLSYQASWPNPTASHGWPWGLGHWSDMAKSHWPGMASCGQQAFWPELSKLRSDRSWVNYVLAGVGKLRFVRSWVNYRRGLIGQTEAGTDWT